MKGFQPPNYTQIPNEIFDVWMEKLTPAEFKVLLCVCRKTFGFHKNEDSISLKQIQEMTGLSRKGIVKNIGVLLEHSLIVKEQNKSKWGDFDPNTFAINVNSVGGGRELSTPGVGNSVHHRSELSTPLTTKETITKENIQKNIAQSRASHGHEQRPDFSFSSSSGKFEGITESDLDEWKAAYPEIDVRREISKAQQWLLSNPSKARKKLWRKFLTGWFGRANDKAENQKAYRSQSGSSKVDRRTLDKHGNPVESPADGLF